MDGSGSVVWVPTGYNVVLVQNKPGDSQPSGDKPLLPVSKFSPNSKQRAPTFLPQILANGESCKNNYATPALQGIENNNSDGVSRPDYFSDDVDPQTLQNTVDLDYGGIDPTLPWPWGEKDSDSTLCQVCNASFLSMNEMIRHYMSTPCGYIFIEPEKKGPDRPRLPAESVRILGVSKKSRGRSGLSPRRPSSGLSSDNFPPGGLEELNRLVKEYLIENNIDYIHSSDESDSDSEEKRKVRLEVVLDKMASPPKFPRVKNSPLAVKMRNGGTLPRKLYRASSPRRSNASDKKRKMVYHSDNDEDHNYHPMTDLDLFEESINELDFDPDFSPPQPKRHRANKPKPRLAMHAGPPILFPEVKQKKTTGGKPKGVSHAKKHIMLKSPTPSEDSGFDINALIQAAKKVEKTGQQAKMPGLKSPSRLKSPHRGAAITPLPAQPSVYLCDLCCHQAKTDEDLQYHYGMVHQISVCPVCQEKIADPHDYDQHVRSHKALYSCHICGRNVTTKLGYVHHLKGHGDTNLYECDVCNDLFQTEKGLKVHLVTHAANKKRYKCELCPLAYASRENRDRHQQNHAHRARLNCFVCNQACESRDMLKIHMTTHIQVTNSTSPGRARRLYQCRICGETTTVHKKILPHLNQHRFYPNYTTSPMSNQTSPRSNCTSPMSNYTSPKPNATFKPLSEATEIKVQYVID